MKYLKVVNKDPKERFFKMLGSSILLASIQASIASVEMSSKYSVINFSKDQTTLQAAANALTGYMIISFIWLTGSAMISYGQYSYMGLITSVVANLVLVGWIYFSYIYAFQVAARRYNLKMPKLFVIRFDE